MAESRTQNEEFTEQLKELNCLYGIARLFSQRALSLEQLLRRVAQIVLSAWQFPELACCRIRLRGREFRSKSFRNSSRRMRQELTVRKKRAGYMEIAYVPPCAQMLAPRFLKEERALLKAVTELQHKNIALREIIDQIEIEKREIQSQMAASIERLILPTLARLKDPRLPEEIRGRYLSMIEQNLEQIAEALGLSTLTVERHRHNIRRKLDIAGKKVNLTTFLHQL